MASPKPGRTGSRGRVCFCSFYAYPLLRSGQIEFAGGAEALVVMLAKGLVLRRYEVTMVTCDYGQPQREQIDGITVLRAYVPYRGLPVLRFFHPRLSLATRALLRANAEVYYVCGSGMTAGLAYDISRLRRASFVLAAASDYDMLPSLPHLSARERWWYRRALRGASAVLAQTEFQQRCFQEGFGIAARILPGVVEIPDHVVDPGQDGIVMWLGTYKSTKRPEWFTDLAGRLPQHRFVMAGVIPPPPLTRHAFEQARAAAANCPNLEVRGFQSKEELQKLTRNASLVVHTSPVEGFSNVMLETWAAGLPTVSGVDPDDVVKRRRLGEHVTEFPALVEAVGRLMADPDARRAAGARARAYAIERHAPPVVLDVLCEVLDRQVADVRRARS